MSTQKPSLWRQIQRENFTALEPLFHFLELSLNKRSQIFYDPKFILNLPRRLAAKIKKNTLEDPILRQFVPLIEERILAPGFVLDPVKDQTFCKTGKILQKYNSRALLITTSACAMHCRFCFRQNFPYETEVVGFEREIAYLEADPSISEIILSGGDPLSLSDSSLLVLFNAFERMPQIKRIRFHTRFPIGIPERIDDSFLQILEASSKQIFFVIHCNHSSELDADVIFHLKKILKLGIPVLNQSVLLKGVNDEESVLLDLSETLISHGIIPYYLHQLDLVQGASHFLVSEERALQLVQYLQKNISGFAVPRLVREEAGKTSKTFVY
jgi:EF-P beta-lysylation protein EpmB